MANQLDKPIEEVDPRYDPLDYSLECECCHQPGALRCIDPYEQEIHGVEREAVLCNYCYQTCLDDI